MDNFDLVLGIFFSFMFLWCVVIIPFVHKVIEEHIKMLETFDQLEKDRLRMIMDELLFTARVY